MNEMGGACGTYGRQERCIQGFGVWSLRVRVHLENLDVDGRILKLVFKKWNLRGMDWITEAQDRDRWRALVNAVMNLRVP